MKSELIVLGILWGIFIINLVREFKSGRFSKKKEQIPNDIQKAKINDRTITQSQVNSKQNNKQNQFKQLDTFFKGKSFQKRKTKKIGKLEKKYARKRYKNWFMMNKNLSQNNIIGSLAYDDASMEKKYQFQDYQLESIKSNDEQIKIFEEQAQNIIIDS